MLVVTSFNTKTFDVAGAECDVYPETFTTGLDVSLGGGGGGSNAGFTAHDIKKNKVTRNKVNLTNFIRSIIKK